MLYNCDVMFRNGVVEYYISERYLSQYNSLLFWATLYSAAVAQTWADVFQECSAWKSGESLSSQHVVVVRQLLGVDQPVLRCNSPV